jgi:hypothetical protein
MDEVLFSQDPCQDQTLFSQQELPESEPQKISFRSIAEGQSFSVSIEPHGKTTIGYAPARDRVMQIFDKS